MNLRFHFAGNFASDSSTGRILDPPLSICFVDYFGFVSYSPRVPLLCRLVIVVHFGVILLLASDSARVIFVPSSPVL